MMEAQLYIQKSLRDRLVELQEKNNQFSLRAFARILKVSPASLSEFLSGKRLLSEKMLFKLADNLSLSPLQLEELGHKVLKDKNEILPKDRKNKRVVQLEDDQYFLVSDWHYYTILCLAETKNFKEDYEWIAQRIKSTPKKVKVAVERLIRLNLLTYNEENQLTLNQTDEFVTSEGTLNSSLRKRHSENFDHARESLYNDELDNRDFSFATIAVDPKKIVQAKKMIREFQNKLFDFLEDGDKTEVYEICMQLFPRTNIKKGINNASYQ